MCGNYLNKSLGAFLVLFFIFWGCSGKISEYQDSQSQAQKPLSEKTDWSWPLRKLRLTSFFGENRWDHFHDGIDISSFEGSIRPLASGKVIYLSDRKSNPFENNLGMGNWVAMLHGNNLVSTYMHLLADTNITRKWQLNKNDPLGKSGNSGRSQGAHLHFTVLDPVSKTLYNPLLLLPAMPDEVPPEIKGLIFKTKNGILNIREGETVSKNIIESISVIIRDRISKQEMHRSLGIYRLESRINGNQGPSYRFDQIVFWKGTQKSQKKNFSDIYTKYGYLISSESPPLGNNTIQISAWDYAGNISRKSFQFSVH